MYTMLGIIGVFTTTVGTITILANASINNEENKKENKYKLVKTSKRKVILESTLQCVPGINLLNMASQEDLVKEKINNILSDEKKENKVFIKNKQ